MTVRKFRRLSHVSVAFIDCTISGMTVRKFRRLSHVQELECSGEPLDADTDLFSMTLYIASAKRPSASDKSPLAAEADSNKLIALANLKSGECLTSDRFSSCVIKGRDSRHTKLKTLVMGLKEEEQIVYGCNLTILKGGTHGSVVSWTHVVRGAGK